MYTDRLNSTEGIASSAESERLVEPAVKEYSLQFLLAQGDAALPCSTEDEAWMTSSATGIE